MTIAAEETLYGETVRVKLEQFEGPLDLLLYLIRKNELDICEVSLSRIADQYLESIGPLKDYNLEIAGEFILVAATLMLIKSRALLPEDSPIFDEEDDLESPQELIRRLLEYKKYKEASLALRSRNSLNEVFFTRSVEDPAISELKELAPHLDVSLFQLIQAYQNVLRRTSSDSIHEVQSEAISLGHRIQQVLKRLQTEKEFTFEELFEGRKDRYWIITSFLALLEMCRLTVVALYQVDAFHPIRIRSKLDEDPAAFERIQTLLAQADTQLTYRGE